MKKISINLIGQRIKCGSGIWEVHLTDKDSFPSNPHADRVDKPEKLNLYNGEVFSKINLKRVGKVHKKDMRIIHAEIMNRGEEKVIGKLKGNKHFITYMKLSKTK